MMPTLSVTSRGTRSSNRSARSKKSAAYELTKRRARMAVVAGVGRLPGTVSTFTSDPRLRRRCDMNGGPRRSEHLHVNVAFPRLDLRTLLKPTAGFIVRRMFEDGRPCI